MPKLAMYVLLLLGMYYYYVLLLLLGKLNNHKVQCRVRSLWVPYHFNAGLANRHWLARVAIHFSTKSNQTCIYLLLIVHI